MKKTELSKSLNELLILTALKDKEKHGYQISKEIEERSDGFFKVPPGTLYPILTKFENEGLITGRWEVTEKSRKRKFYLITKKGEAELVIRANNWREFFTNLFGIVGAIR